MSIWILPVALIVGTAIVVSLGIYLTKDLDDQGEPLEHWE